MDPPNLENSGFSFGKTMNFRKSAFRKSHRFLIDLGANMAPFWLPKTFQILPKIDPKMHQIFDRFLHRFFLHFGSILGPKLGPCWPHFPPKWGDPVWRRPPFCWVYLIFRFLGRPGPLLAQFGLDFGTVSYTHLTLPTILLV